MTTVTVGSPTPPQLPRHALNLPAGSIRSLLAFGLLAYLWVLALSKGPDGTTLLAQQQVSQTFIYMMILLTLVLANFFISHGKTIGRNVSRQSPLGMPAGSVRLLLIAGYFGLAYFLYTREQKFVLADTGPFLLTLASLLTAFILGNRVTAIMTYFGRGVVPAWFQDIQAWFALLGLVILGIIIVIRTVIFPTISAEKQFSLEFMEVALSVVVGFYFGARS